MRVYDCFLFNDELDLLELRLMELEAVVDTFVLCEMAHNFRMQPKPLHFAENKDRFKRWKDRIRHVVVKDYPIQPHPVMEHYQRRSLALGLNDASVGDVIIVGDVDEIPHVNILSAARNGIPHGVALQQRLYYYTVDYEQPTKWVGSVLLPYTGKPPDCEHLRQSRYYLPILADGGWHFSWLGNADQLAAKLLSIDVDGDSKLYGTEKEIKAPDPCDREFLEKCVDTGSDLFGRERLNKRLVPIEPGVRQPTCIEVWLDKHPHYARATVTR